MSAIQWIVAGVIVLAAAVAFALVDDWGGGGGPGDPPRPWKQPPPPSRASRLVDETRTDLIIRILRYTDAWAEEREAKGLAAEPLREMRLCLDRVMAEYEAGDRLKNSAVADAARL